MDYFSFRNGQLFCEDLDLDELAGSTGTPVFVYSRRTLVEHFNRFCSAFAELNPLVCFSVKSCNNLSLLSLLADQGAGMDVVSGGELFRAVSAGTPPDRIVYAGSAKTKQEIREALQANIGWFNIESEGEFEVLAAVSAEMGRRPQAALRINPNIYDPNTPEKTTTGRRGTKFGIDINRAIDFFERARMIDYVDVCGIHIHLGSPIHTPDPYVQAITKVLSLVEQLGDLGIVIRMIDIGGGFPAEYIMNDPAISWDAYASAICPLLKDFVRRGGQIVIEPGRTISANAGVLLTRVQYTKSEGDTNFVLVDTGMHHLIRVTLYDAYHFIWPTQVDALHVPAKRTDLAPSSKLKAYNIAGPICESGDYIAKDRQMPAVSRGDLLCIFSTGAYGMVMASQYNAFPRPPEVLVDGTTWKIIRRRETYRDLVACELDAVLESSQQTVAKSSTCLSE